MATSPLMKVPASPGNFATTQWTVVTEAANPASPESTEALGELFSSYWYPLYAYVRRTGKSPGDAQDLTQSFFVYLLEKNVFRIVERKRGKFRWFLLATFKHFLANERRSAETIKRGGNTTPVSLDGMAAEERYRHEPTDHESADLLYDRRWALTLLETARLQLREEAKDPKRFAILEQYLPGGTARPHAEVAKELGTTAGSLKVEVHRFKKRYAKAVRDEIAKTVSHEDEIDSEIRHLIDAIFRV